MAHRSTFPVPATASAPLDQARAAFDWLSSGPRPLTIDGAAFAGMPARALRLDEVRDLLQEPGCRAVTRDAVWAFLVHRARVEAGAWTVACVGAAMPALREASGRLCRGLPAIPTTPDPAGPPAVRPRTAIAGVPDYPDSPTARAGGHAVVHDDHAAVSTVPAVGPRDLRPARPHREGPVGASAVFDIEAALLSGFLAELAVIDLTRRGVLARLQSAAHEAGVLAKREMERAPIPHARLFTSCPAPPPARHPDLVLARAVTAGAITPNEAALIGSTRLEPTTLAAVAVQRGQSYRDVRAARVRAERKLSAFLRDQDTGPIHTSRTDTATATPTGTRAGARSSTKRGRTIAPGRRRSPTGAGIASSSADEAAGPPGDAAPPTPTVTPRAMARRRSRLRRADARTTSNREIPPSAKLTPTSPGRHHPSGSANPMVPAPAHAHIPDAGAGTPT